MLTRIVDFVVSIIRTLPRMRAFIVSNPETRKEYTEMYAKTSALYYGRKLTFEEILKKIGGWIDRM